MTEVGEIHIRHDSDRGIVLEVETKSTSKYDGLEGQGENLRESLTELLENVESAWTLTIIFILGKLSKSYKAIRYSIHGANLFITVG